MNIQRWSAFVLGASITLGLKMLYQAFNLERAPRSAPLSIVLDGNNGAKKV